MNVSSNTHFIDQICCYCFLIFIHKIFDNFIDFLLFVNKITGLGHISKSHISNHFHSIPLRRGLFRLSNLVLLRKDTFPSGVEADLTDDMMVVSGARVKSGAHLALLARNQAQLTVTVWNSFIVSYSLQMFSLLNIK